jgi:poly(hydroxyalkanoate) granule-associated protein
MSARDDEAKVDTGRVDVVEAGRTIWWAGLGALAEVERGGRQVFDELVERGRHLERRQLKSLDRTVARASEAAEEIGEQVRSRVQGGVGGVLHRAHLPSRDDLKALAARLDRLAERIEALQGS